MNAAGIRIVALAFLALFLAGCSTTPEVHFHPEAVRAKMTALCEQHKFQAARELKVQAYPPEHPKAGTPSPEEITKKQLVATLVNPSETAFKTLHALELLLDDALDSGRGDDEIVQRASRLFFRAQDRLDQRDWAGAADLADRALELLGAPPVSSP